MLHPSDTEEINIDDEQLEISVSDAQKIGEGMRAYVAYKVTTQSNLPYFKYNFRKVILRRFSNFLVLHKNLVKRYQHFGIIVPPPPEKSVRAMVKIKVFRKDVVLSDDFIEKRRAALERYINRIAFHPILKEDEDLHNFLHNEYEPPKALRDAEGFRVYSRIKQTVNMMTFDMDETNLWFAEKEHNFEILDKEMSQMLAIAKTAIDHRKSTAKSEALFARSATSIGIHNKGTALSIVFLQLAEVKEKMENLATEQANCDVHLLVELLNDYIGLMPVAKKVFDLRVKAYQTWKQAQGTFNAKRDRKREIASYSETQTPTEALCALPYVPKLEKKVAEQREKKEIAEEKFETISKVIRNEIVHFERTVVREFKTTIVKYMETLLKSHNQMSKYSEESLQKVKALF